MERYYTRSSFYVNSKMLVMFQNGVTEAFNEGPDTLKGRSRITGINLNSFPLIHLHKAVDRLTGWTGRILAV